MVEWTACFRLSALPMHARPHAAAVPTSMCMHLCNDPSGGCMPYLSFVQQLAEMSGDGGEAVLLRGLDQVRGHI